MLRPSSTLVLALVVPASSLPSLLYSLDALNGFDAQNPARGAVERVNCKFMGRVAEDHWEIGRSLRFGGGIGVVIRSP